MLEIVLLALTLLGLAALMVGEINWATKLRERGVEVPERIPRRFHDPRDFLDFIP